MFNKKEQICKWHRCTIGKRYHHTIEEWNVHAEYAKNDIPTIYEEVTKPVQYVEEGDFNNGRNSGDTNPDFRKGTMPAGYTAPQYQQRGTTMGISDKVWRIAAIGSMVAVWITIGVVMLR